MTLLIVHCAPSGLESPPTNVENSTWNALRSEGSGYYDTVEPPLTTISPQRPPFYNGHFFWPTVNIMTLV